MKKLSIILMLALAGWSLTACDESHDDYATPTVYPQEEVFNMSDIKGFVATPTAAASSNIDLGTMTEDSIKLFNLQMGTLPKGLTFDSLRFEAWPADKSEYVATKAKVAANGMIAKEDLAKLVYTFYGKKVTERVFKAKLMGNAFKGKEAFLIELGDFTLRITPEEMENPYYYIYGGATSAKKEDAYKTVMTPDPKSDVIYSYTTKYYSSGDVKVWNSKYWQEGQKKNDFTKLYGSGEEKPTSYKGLEGKLKQGSTSSIFSPTKEYYTFTIDLEKLTYTWVKLENQNPTSYTAISLIGIGGDWNTDVDLVAADKAKHNWFAKVTIAADTQLKFRADHDWAANWGFGASAGDWTVNDDIWAKTCEKDAGNIAVPAGTYYVYFCDITGAAHFVPAE